MHRCIPVAFLAAAVLAAPPAGAISSTLVRTFTPDVALDFDALALGALAAGTTLAPGVVFDGADPPFVLGVAATVVATGGGNRALDLAPGQTAGFVFDPPVAAAGVSVEQIVAGAQVTVTALDAANESLSSFGYIYQPGEPIRYPEFTDAADTPIVTMLVKSQGGTYRVDDLDFIPVPAPTAPHAYGAALAALLALARWRPRRDSNP